MRDSARQAENLHACLDGGVQGIAKFWMRHAIGQHFRHARHGDDKCNETFIAIFHRLYQFMQVLDTAFRWRVGKISDSIYFERASFDFNQYPPFAAFQIKVHS